MTLVLETVHFWGATICHCHSVRYHQREPECHSGSTIASNQGFPQIGIAHERQGPRSCHRQRRAAGSSHPSVVVGTPSGHQRHHGYKLKISTLHIYPVQYSILYMDNGFIMVG